MGYFSNGTEGMAYEDEYCSKCVHNYNQPKTIGSDSEHYRKDGRGLAEDSMDAIGCPVWMLHMTHNYDECNKPDSFLHHLIPQDKENCWNERCAMFIDRRQSERNGQTELMIVRSDGS